MKCEQWFEAVSAFVDGEDPGVDPRLLEAHLADCTNCGTVREQLERLRRSTRVTRAESMPDLSPRIMKAAAFADRASRWLAVRALLALIAVYAISVSILTLVVAEDSGNSLHGARHIGAFTLAYGAGLLVVVVRPARARTMLPVAATLGLALAITAVVDVVDGQVPLVNEALHLPELVSVLLIWLLAVPALLGQTEPPRTGTEGLPSLQVVGKRSSSRPDIPSRDAV